MHVYKMMTLYANQCDLALPCLQQKFEKVVLSKNGQMLTCTCHITHETTVFQKWSHYISILCYDLPLQVLPTSPAPLPVVYIQGPQLLYPKSTTVCSTPPTQRGETWEGGGMQKNFTTLGWLDYFFLKLGLLDGMS